MPYPVMNTLLDAGYPKGALNYWLSSFTPGLSDALIDTMVERFATVPRRCGDDPRAFPRRGNPHRPDGDRRAAPRDRVQPPLPLRVDWTRGHRTRTSPGRSDALAAVSEHSRRVAG